MGAKQSAPVDTYEIKVLEKDPGSEYSAKKKNRKRSLKPGPEPEAKPSTEAVSPGGSGGSKLKEVSAAKKKLLKAKNLIVAANALNSAGADQKFRQRRMALKPAGWIAKDLNPGPACNPNKFESGRVIGTGLMGQVRIAKWKKDNTWCVLKAIRKDYVTRHNDGRHIQNERRILNELDHPFIVRLFGTFQDAKRIYFILEYVPGGELFSRLQKKDRFSANIARFYLSEICLVLEYIHECGLAYRDLKPENILIDEDGHSKVIDFGFSRDCGPEERMKTQVGTPAYLSPEQLDGKFTGGYTRNVDWWSFGIITYELATGKTPFCRSNKESPFAIYTRVQKGKMSFPRHYDAEAKDMTKKLLTADMSKRLVAPERIKEHKFFEGIDFDAVYERRVVPPHVPKIGEPGDCHYFDEYGEPPDNPDKNSIDDSLFYGF